MLLSRKTSSHPRRAGESDRGRAAWGSSADRGGCVTMGDQQAAVEESFSFRGRDGGSLKSAEISASQENEWMSETRPEQDLKLAPTLHHVQKLIQNGSRI